MKHTSTRGMPVLPAQSPDPGRARAGRSGERGFTMVEVINVLAIVSVLSALSTPSYTHYISKSRQAEGVVALSALYDQQVVYRHLHDRYATSFEEMGYDSEGEFRVLADGSLQGRYYNIVLANPTGSDSFHFVATANLDHDDYLDIMEIFNDL